MKLNEGEQAPNFCLSDQNDKRHCLTDYSGKWLLIYFYPKDDTPGCTKEACGIRDNLTSFNRLGLTVFGISKDSLKSHQRFAQKYSLNFPLLSDESEEVNRLYDVWQLKKFMGREYWGTQRTSFLISPSGEIAKIYQHVKPEGHAEEVLRDLQILQK